MSADPAWFLFRVQPKDVSSVKKAFEQAVEQSQIAEKSHEFLENQIRSDKFQQQDRDHLNRMSPGVFVDKWEQPDAFDWDDLHDTFELFSPSAFTELFDGLFIGDPPIISESAEALSTLT